MRVRQRRRILLDILDRDADAADADEQPGVTIEGQADGAAHAGMAGQPLEAGLRAALQVFVVDEEVVEQLEARSGTGARRGRTADASRRKRADRVPGHCIPWVRPAERMADTSA